MKQKLILILSILLLSNVAKSQEKLTLQDVLSSISANHPDLKALDAQMYSLDEAAKGARNWDPLLLATGLWMTPYNPSAWKKQTGESSGMGQYMISAEQMFPNAKMQNAELKYLQALSTVEKERKNATINELRAQAKKSFYQWITSRKKLEILDQNERVLEFMIKDAELRYKNNLGKISAYYKAKASLGNIQAMRITLENAIVQQRILLNTLMNRDKNVMFGIDTAYSIQDFSSIQFDSTTFLNARSDIKAVDKEIQLTTLQKEVEMSRQRPEFGVRFDHMVGFGGQPMQYSLMGMMKLPLRQSTRTSRANIESLKWKAESLSQEKQGLLNEASGMAEGVKSEVASRKRQIELYKNNIIPALRKNFQTTQIAYQNNTEELFGLYDAWETLNMAQLQYLDELQQLLIMQAELERILEVK